MVQAETGGTGAGQPPVVRASDGDRDAVVAHLQAAVGEGRIALDEFGQRAEAAYAAVTTAELDALLADLPTGPQVEIVGMRSPEALRSVFGDIRWTGAFPPARASTVFGNVRIDLRSLRTDADRIELFVSTIFGDIDVILAEGVDGELHGRTALGNR